MDYKEFFKIIKTNAMSGAYILYGVEAYIKDIAVKTIIEQYVKKAMQDMNVVSLSGDDCDYKSIENAQMTLPFMTEKRIVIVNDYSVLNCSATQLKQSGNVGKAEELKKLISQCPEETILLFVQRSTVISVIAKLFDKSKRAEFKHPTKGDKEKIILSMAKKVQLKISQSNVRMLIEYTSMELLALNKEIQKLKSYVNDNEVKKEDIYEICIAGTEYNVFSMLKCLANSDGAKAISIYRKLLQDGQSPQAIISMIQRQFRALFYMDEINNSKTDYQQVAEKLKTKDFIVENMSYLAKQLTSKKRVEVAKWCADADYLVKRGKIAIDSSAEMLIMKLIDIKG